MAKLEIVSKKNSERFGDLKIISYLSLVKNNSNNIKKVMKREIEMKRNTDTTRNVSWVKFYPEKEKVIPLEIKITSCPCLLSVLISVTTGGNSMILFISTITV